MSYHVTSLNKKKKDESNKEMSNNKVLKTQTRLPQLSQKHDLHAFQIVSLIKVVPNTIFKYH